MKKEDIKTIDINCLEWFDKVNGNSYFAGAVTINYGMKDQLVINMPFQYGYGGSYESTGLSKVKELGLIDSTYTANLRDKGIILRSSIARNRKKRELIVFND